MKGKLDSLRRIERVRRQLHDLAARRLAALARAREALASDHREMIEALGRDIIGGPPALAAARAVRAVERRIDASAADHRAQSEAARQAAAGAKLAERAVSAADAIHRAQRERKNLAELVERWLCASRARLG
jgi:hypothetical protein